MGIQKLAVSVGELFLVCICSRVSGLNAVLQKYIGFALKLFHNMSLQHIINVFVSIQP